MTSCGVVDYLLCGVVIPRWASQNTETRARLRMWTGFALEMPGHALAWRLQCFPKVNTAATPRPCIEQIGFLDQVRVSLPRRHAKSVFGQGIFTAHSLRQAKQHDLLMMVTTSVLSARQLTTDEPSLELRVVRLARRLVARSLRASYRLGWSGSWCRAAECRTPGVDLRLLKVERPWRGKPSSRQPVTPKLSAPGKLAKNRRCKMLWGGRRGNCIHRRFYEPTEGAPHAISE